LAGVLGYQKLIKPEAIPTVVNQLATNKPVVNQPVVSTSDETAGWKTYKIGKEQYGFEIKYPNEWFTEENEAYTDESIRESLKSCKERTDISGFGVGSLILKSQNFPKEFGSFGYFSKEAPSGAIFEISIFCNPAYLGYKDYVNMPSFSPNSKDMLEIGGATAFRSESSASAIDENGKPIHSYSVQMYGFIHNGLEYTIRTWVYIKPGTSELEAEALGNNFLPVFEQMLSTFKFIK